MIKIGLTGNIGVGKAEAARALEALGATVIFADAVSRQVYEPGQAGFDAVVREFGEKVVGPDGRIDRKALAAIVFSSEEQRKRLESAVWPVMAEAVERQMADAEAKGAPAVALEAAVLFEAGWERLVDEVWTVVAPDRAVIERVGRRDGLSEDQVKARLKAQLPAEEKARRADRVIVNDGSLDGLREQVRRAWEEVAGQGKSR
jgi:dephospho-CoA kinase